MTSRRRAHVYEIDPDRPAVPASLYPPAGDSGIVVALLADEASRRHGWSGQLALELASGWSGSQGGVVLVDGDLATGSLHEIVGARNDEGLSDLLVYGASSRRVTQRLSEAGPSFVPSGTVVGDPEKALREERWSTLLAASRTGGSILLLYLPAGATGVAALAEEADQVIRLVCGPPEGELDPGVVWIHTSGQELLEETLSSPNPGGPEGRAPAPAREELERPEQAGGSSARRRVFLASVITISVLLVVMLVVAWLGEVTSTGITP